MLRSDLCDYSDAYIVVKRTITVNARNNGKKNKAVVFKNNAPFINCISKMNCVKIDNSEDLDVVMPMYNLLEYSKNYKKTTGSLWNYYRDEPNDPLSSDSESFKYKNNIAGNTYNVDLTVIGEGGNPIPNPNYDENKVGKNETEVVIPLNYLSNFWRSLNIPLADMTVDAAYNPNIVAPTGLEFKITDTKLYVPVVSLSKENDIKFLEQLKSGFKRTIKRNKYRSQMTIQPQNNNLNYLIDPTFTDVNRLFVLSF